MNIKSITMHTVYALHVHNGTGVGDKYKDILINGKLSTDGWDHLEININRSGVYTCIPTGHMWTLSLRLELTLGGALYCIGCVWYTVECPASLQLVISSTQEARGSSLHNFLPLLGL